MRTFKIYTAGKMSGLTYEQQMHWRSKIATLLSERAGDVSVKVVNPPEYYNPMEETAPTFEREAMIWDLNQIRESDVVIVNLDEISSSIGTHCEIGFINAMNSFGDKHIYVVGFGRTAPKDLHPWIRMNLFHWESTIEGAADYILSYLLV